MSIPRQTRIDAAQVVRRMDRLQVGPNLRPATHTSAGYLVVDAAFAVPGVMEYADASGGIVRELIDADELHNPQSLATAAAVPVTLLHPDERVTPDNVSQLGVGAAGTKVQILEQSGHVVVELVVQRRDALDAIGAGVQEISPVYTCEIDPTPGEHPVYGPYDRRQLNRQYSEIAIVPEARGGHTVHLNADSDDRVASRRADAAPPNQATRTVHLDAAPPTPPPARSQTMIPYLLLLASALRLPYSSRADGTAVRTDGTRADMDVTPEQLQAAIMQGVQAAVAELEALKAKMEEGGGEGSEQDMATLIAERDALKQRVADMEGQMAEQQEKTDRARMDSLADALRLDRSTWTDTTTAAQRGLYLLQAKGLVTQETQLRSDAAPDGLSAERLDALLFALEQFQVAGADTTPRPPAGAPPLHLDGRPPAPPPGPGAPPRPGPQDRQDGATQGSGDPFLDRLRREQKAAAAK